MRQRSNSLGAPQNQPDELTPLWSRRLGEHVQAARTRALLSRAQLALRLGVTEETIRRWEAGGVRPSPEHLARLVVVLALDTALLDRIDLAPHDLPPLAKALRDERARRRISQAQAGEMFGVAQPTYAGWEVGRALPNDRHLEPLAEFLGTSEERLRPLISTPFVVDSSNWPRLGRLIGRQREQLRLTRDELARLVGVTTATVVAWELGYRTPPAQQIHSLATAIEVSVDQLVAALPHRELQLSALGQLIVASQQRLGLRLRDIAERARIDQATLSRWMHGRHEPEPSSLRRLAAAVELPYASVIRAARLAP